MLTLWLARHGEAVDPDEARSDFDRMLTDTGRRRLSALTRGSSGRSAQFASTVITFVKRLRMSPIPEGSG